MNASSQFGKDKHKQILWSSPNSGENPRGREEGDGTENVINYRKLSQIVVTFYDEFYDVL